MMLYCPVMLLGDEAGKVESFFMSLCFEAQNTVVWFFIFILLFIQYMSILFSSY